MKTVHCVFLICAVTIMVCTAANCRKTPLVETFYGIIVRNNSNDTIYVERGLGGSYPFPQYPDTSLPASKPSLKPIAPKATFTLYSPDRKPYEQVIDELVEDTLAIYIFSNNAYKFDLWEDVRKDYNVLQRYDLSKENLKTLNFNIPYPPTAEMAGMKMYP